MADPIDRLAYWINEREKIRKQKDSGKPPPWTEDKILQTFKFCNVRREDDRVTRWIDSNWRSPHYDDERAWFAMGVARLINFPDTLKDIGYPIPWYPEEVAAAMRKRKQNRQQVFTGAYMITNAGMKKSKIDTVVHMLNNLYALPTPPARDDTLEQAFGKLRAAHCAGMGSFIAAQVIADCKHMSLLQDASDWMNWCAPGPGSTRGLNRLINVRVKNPKSFIFEVSLVRKHLGLETSICLQDMQNCLCEFDKYERTLWGEGRPRSHYTPTH
jgi:hypothetical protein